MTKKSKEEILAEMDAAAKEAILRAGRVATADATGEDVVRWLHSNYLQAGYKRLCRYLYKAYGIE